MIHLPGRLSWFTILDSYYGNITYNSGSTYRTNLNFLLDTLSSHASRTDNNGFYNFSTGDDASNKVYGVFLCRGDVNTDVCKECVADAHIRLLDECPNQTAAIVWYDECLLRFSDQTIFSKADLGENLTRCNPINVPGPDWDKFKMVLKNLLHNAADEAANHTLGKKFAVQEGNYSTDQKRLYTLTQCTPDLSPYDCKRCLTEAIVVVPACCSKKQGGRVIYPSCNLRYEVSVFYDTVSSASPNSPGGPPPNSTEEDVIKRPTMASVVCMLNPSSVPLPTPHRPAVFRSHGSESRVDELKVDQSNAQRISAPSSVNEASITEPYPR
nr:cysteine-rich receptor-like protein kinase 25 [Coffea arabica]